ncbi:hypothetical protein PO124_08800 [Bacillus licheniformis]|nr:hypothetical protein [Bacillus licheniformis]
MTEQVSSAPTGKHTRACLTLLFTAYSEFGSHDAKDETKASTWSTRLSNTTTARLPCAFRAETDSASNG